MPGLRQSDPARMTNRLDAIDFWRGLVLCTIFINHIPGNLFEVVTQKNYGFSDSAEAFVFLSGLSLALAYGPRFARGDLAEPAMSLARRAVKLYFVHIVLSVAAIGIFALGAFALDGSTLLDVHGRDLFVEDPKAALIGLASLGHQLGYFNILPMYIVLLALVPPLLWVGCRHPNMMLGASAALYVSVRVWNLNVPTWPMKGTWFFDPFAWQFLMAIGLWVGLMVRRGRLPSSVPVMLLALCTLLAALVSVTDGFSLVPYLQDWTRGWADLDKGVLGLGRLAHFLALAYAVYALRLTDLLRGGRAYDAMCRLGRHSLWIFAFLSLLAAGGQVVTEWLGHTPIIDSLLICGGLVILNRASLLLELRASNALPPAAVQALAPLRRP